MALRINAGKIALGLLILLVAASGVSAETWTFTGNLVTGRIDHTTTVLPNGKVLVTGGRSQEILNASQQPGVPFTNLRSAEIYDPATGTWAATGSMITGRGLHQATLLPNGKVLITGGQRGRPDGFTLVMLDSAELYDPDTGTFTAAGFMTVPREQHSATLLSNGKVLIAGGRSAEFDSFLSSAELYDPTIGAFSPTGTMSQVRHGHPATLLPNGKVLVAGGGFRTLGPTATAELYDPITGNWTAAGSMNVTRVFHSVTLLSDGKVLLAGGLGGVGGAIDALSSAELYDPSTETFSFTGSMAVRRAGHSATLRQNGTVLVAGGTDNQQTHASAELYDPATGTWTATASMNVARSSHSAALLANGDVLTAAGFQLPLQVLGSAELFGAGIDLFLDANAGTLFLNTTPPTATTAQFKDSPSVNFIGGNPWKEIGTWSAGVVGSAETLIALKDLHAWLGLKNSDDIGTRFDLRAEVLKNGAPVAVGEVHCITGVTRNPNLAKEVSVPLGPITNGVFNAGDVLSLRVLTRIGTVGTGAFCGGHSNAVGLRLYFDSAGRPSRFNATFQQ